jgi:NAD(P)-dependent dehydrogenase (short-subunit alcohol dehydrogenase family)
MQSQKTIIVTGASRGIGKAIVEKYAQAGWQVVFCSKNEDSVAKTLRELTEKYPNTQIDGKVCDMSQKKAVLDFATYCSTNYSNIQILVNNAGVGTAVPATHETPDQFRSVLDVNLFGAYWMSQAFAKANKNGGAIVNISSILGIKPQGLPQAAYASSKAGLIGLTRDLAAQWTGRKGIRVNALAPGFFPSEMTEELPKDMVNMIKMFAPAGRLGEPEELAATLIWLVSDASSYVTGITVPVDGGLVMP